MCKIGDDGSRCIGLSEQEEGSRGWEVRGVREGEADPLAEDEGDGPLHTIVQREGLQH